MDRTTSAPAALSPVATTAQAGRFFQAGGPFFSPNPAAATGRCAAAITAASFSGRSPAKALWNAAGSIRSSVSVPDPPG